MLAKDGVGLKHEQVTIRASTWQRQTPSGASLIGADPSLASEEHTSFGEVEQDSRHLLTQSYITVSVS